MMKKHFLGALALLILSFCAPQSLKAQSDYDKAWEALNKNDFDAAKSLFEAALNNPKTATDAAAALIELATFNVEEEKANVYWTKIAETATNQYPYLYAYWFNNAVIGGYGRKKDAQLALMKKLMKDDKAPNMLNAALRYQLGHHLRTKKQFDDMREVWQGIGALNDWAFVGPFDNISGSGFDKNYPPILRGKADAMFKATNNADIKWFTPATQDKDGWVSTSFYIQWNTGIVYAQTFVTAPADMPCTVAAGMSGNIKVFVNDKLVVSEQDARSSDFDVFSAKYRLKKGVNRILVQLGYEDESNPNFAIRLLDDNGKPIQGLTTTSDYQAYTPDTEGEVKTIKFWAEQYFEDKIKEDPNNLINYVALCQVYLRAMKGQEALETIEKALAKAPDNLILRFQRIQCYLKTENRTNLSEEIENIIEKAPDCALSIQNKYYREFNNEKYEEATELLDKWESLLGKSASTLIERIKLLNAQEKTEPLLRLVEEGYREYPDVEFFTEVKYNIEVNLNKNPIGAMSIWEKYLKQEYNTGTASNMAEAYLKIGENKKALALYEEILELYPQNPDNAAELFDYYLGKKQIKKAETYLNMMLALAPFHANYWDSAAKLAEQQGDETAELEHLQRSLHYNSNDFDVRRRIRELQKKKDLFEAMPKIEPYNAIKKTKTEDKEGEHNWYYIADEKQTIVYPERNAEVWHTYIIKILTEKGVDEWKQTSLGYNSSREKLIIDKAEIVKPNGSKLRAEERGNQLVFTNLQKGDAIYIKYRTQSYAYGRMAREFWDKYAMTFFVPIEFSRYSLLVPKDIPIDIKMEQGENAPKITEIDEYKMYVWEKSNIPAMKREPNSPRFYDISNILHLSTINDWKTITTWYADVSAQQAKQDYDIKQLVQTLFPAGKTYTELEKAQIIYYWITKNIRYSSIPFRQSGYIPQRASKVIQTKLGDCKDLSTLFATLAREVGMKANLVLINTRNNGEKDMVLPSMEFNHCIVKVTVNNTPYYLELTDNDLPFAALPVGDMYAMALEIPYNDSPVSNKPFLLNPDNRLRDTRETVATVNIKNRDFQVSSKNFRQGVAVAELRNTYQNLTKQKAIESIQKSIGGHFQNPVTVKDLYLGDFTTVKDTTQFLVNYNVKNEVVEIGDLKTFKVPFFSTFLKADAFQLETRTLPLNYLEYEDVDLYKETVVFNLSEGKVFSDAPQNINLSFKGIKYTLSFEKKSATQMQVTRTIDVVRQNISVEDYPAFREFVDEVVAAESKYISFK